MCRLATVAVLVLAVSAGTAQAQNTPVWNRVAGTALNLGLAGPATGSVRSVWYSGDGLLVRTDSGRVFETTDFRQWRLNSADTVPAGTTLPPATLNPESGQITSIGAQRYSLTQGNVYGSTNAGAWVNLTGMNGQSILGDGFSALAVAASNPLDVTVGNRFGVWRSLDGGLSWQGLNDELPNLPARRLIGQRSIVLANGTLAAVTAGKWELAEGVDAESVLRASLASKSGLSATAAAQSGPIVYAGAGIGELLVSADDGATWNESKIQTESPVTRIWIDPRNPQTALAAAGPDLFRTTNGGQFWDPVAGALGAGEIHGITADSLAGVVYAATDRGVFLGQLSLNAADPAPAVWTPISRDLPYVTAWDARLNSDGTLAVLLDGYGVYETFAPHRRQAPRIVNGADLSELNDHRAAAPGSLITILGANVKQASARTTAGQLLYPVLAASDQSSQLQVPFETTAGTLQLTVTGAGGAWTAPLNVKNAAPAMFVDSDGAPMIQDAASGLVIDSGTPLHGGALIQVLATGLGRVTPEWPTGVPAPVDSPPAVRAPVTAYLDGRPIQVTSATLAPTFVGYYLVGLQIPPTVNRGASELRIVVNGEESNRVKLYFESDTVALK